MNNTKLTIAIIATIVIVAAILSMVTGNKTGGGKELIRIGVFLPLTGDGAAYGDPMNKAGLLAQEEINARGGVDGRRLEFVLEDDKCEPAGGAAAAQYAYETLGARKAVVISEQTDYAQGITAQIVAEGATMSRDLIAKQAALMAGVIGTEPHFNEKEEDAASFLKRYEKKYREKPAYATYSSYTYSTVYLIKEGIEKVGVDPTKLKDWLYTVKNWKHAMGELSFDQNGDAIAPYSIKQAQADGTVKELTVVRPE